MNKSLPTLQKLVRYLQKLPYLASKNVFKVAGYIISSDLENIQQLCQVILEAKQNILVCRFCYNWTEGSDICVICDAADRHRGMVCVVESWYDLVAVERTGGYKGLYHVLGGVLNPLEGVGPDKLTVAGLVARIQEQAVQEMIFATNSTPEGDATAMYVASRLAKLPVSVSKFASGLPTGSLLEFMDKVTIAKALTGRVPF